MYSFSVMGKSVPGIDAGSCLLFTGASFALIVVHLLFTYFLLLLFHIINALTYITPNILNLTMYHKIWKTKQKAGSLLDQ